MRDVPLKLAILLLGLCVICTSLSAVPAAPLIYGGEAEVRTSVIPTGSFTELGPDTRKSAINLSGIAEKLDRQRIFRWTPSPSGGPMGGADLMDAALSPDGSLFCMAERIGGAGKLNSTRLVLVSPEKGLLGAQTVEELRLLRIGFLPGAEGKIWALAENGREAGLAAFLLIYDLMQGAEVARSQVLPVAAGDILPLDGDLWVASAKDGTLLRYAQNALQDPPERISCGFAAPALTVRGADLLAFGRGDCAICSLRDGTVVLTGALKVPPGCRPVWSQPMPGTDAGFAVVTEDGRGGILRQGKFTVLRESDAAPGWVFPENGKLIFGDRRQEVLYPFALPALEQEKEVRPGKERPASRNRTFRTFAMQEKVPALLQVDERGNVFAVRLERRRVRKTPVLIVDRTGFR